MAPKRKRVRRSTAKSKDTAQKSEIARQEDLTLRLPPELLFMIFSRLPVDDLCRAADVCRRWKSIAVDESLWRRVGVVYLGKGRVPETSTPSHKCDTDTICRVMRLAPCLRSIELCSPKYEEVPQLNMGCEVNELIFHWWPSQGSVELFRGLADRRVASLVLLSAPSKVGRLCMALWSELEVMAPRLRRLKLAWDYPLVPDIDFVFHEGVDSLEALDVSTACPPTLVASLIAAHRHSLRRIKLPLHHAYLATLEKVALLNQIDKCTNLEKIDCQ